MNEQQWYYLTYSWVGEADGIYIFFNGISCKVNRTARLKFELIFFKCEVQHFNHYAIIE